VAAPPQTSTRSGRTIRFPRRFDDFLPVMRTALAHIPSKECLNRNPPQAIGTVTDLDPTDPLDVPSLATIESQSSDMACDDPHNSVPVTTTDTDCFGVYRVYDRKSLFDPLPSLEPTDSGSDCQPGTPPNQGPPHQIEPYYHPFSNPSAAAMLVPHHSAPPVQS
jgi:hypothetical protein